MARNSGYLSQRSIKARAKVLNAVFIIAIIIGLTLALNSTWKGYDETRIEKYQYYTFVYENTRLVEIRVKLQVFNVLCDSYNESEHSCSITSKTHMREFKALVNR